MTLTRNNSTSWATSAKEEAADSSHRPKGLNHFGTQAVKRMNALGMMVDLSHVGENFLGCHIYHDKTCYCFTQLCIQLCPVFRNLKDEEIKAIGKNGGVIHINFYSGFLDSNFSKKQEAFFRNHKTTFDSLITSGKQSFFAEDYIFENFKEEAQALRPPLSLLLDHIDYIVKLIGVDHVGLGSDFDGITSSPQQLDDVTDFPLITKALLERGYSKKDIEKTLGRNFIRIFKANATH